MTKPLKTRNLPLMKSKTLLRQNTTKLRIKKLKKMILTVTTMTISSTRMMISKLRKKKPICLLWRKKTRDQQTQLQLTSRKTSHHSRMLLV